MSVCLTCSTDPEFQSALGRPDSRYKVCRACARAKVQPPEERLWKLVAVCVRYLKADTN